jgi:NADPH:quinone reductase-like Zn-dependent oxidoreductase
MRAFFLNPADMTFEMREAPAPRPAHGQLLVRVRTAGLNRGEFLRHGLTRPGPA